MEQTHTIGMRATIVLLTCDTEVHVRGASVRATSEVLRLAYKMPPLRSGNILVKKVWMYAPPGLIC